MAYKIPWSNFHELNLDWLLEQVKQLREDVDNITGSATPYTSIPEMDGIGSPGTAVSYARGDHRHPTDTSRAAATDLAQEILDRDGADNTLQANIDATDAKIKFSSSAPIMDSSSASAGFSDYMARADHIHPTDTSRASATDLATLTARVDAFAGSAVPYDSTPEMDGVGYAGSVGSYARGNHVHPKDTTKVDKTGDTVTGRILFTEREQYIHTDAVAWLRIATVPNTPGTAVKIRINRKGDITPSELHEIVLCINANKIAFGNEYSNSDVLYVNKIRYSNAGKIDIHMDQSYEADIAITIDPLGPTNAATALIKAETITGVADAPAGETIITEYTFVENTDIPKTTFTPLVGAAYNPYGDCWYMKAGRNCHLHLGISGLTAGTAATVFNMPTDFIPQDTVCGVGLGLANDPTISTSRALIYNDGVVEIMSTETYALIDIDYIII